MLKVSSHYCYCWTGLVLLIRKKWVYSTTKTLLLLLLLIHKVFSHKKSILKAQNDISYVKYDTVVVFCRSDAVSVVVTRAASGPVLRANRSDGDQDSAAVLTERSPVHN